ncbi:hypothetical protein HGA64_03210, partial [Candidatus Falkowbacteria bacterium]|nr:hypothetical protein [Candidatus Falkowbacteria bacterium]
MYKKTLPVFILMVALSVFGFGCAKKDLISDGQIPGKNQNLAASSTWEQQSGSSSNEAVLADQVATSTQIASSIHNSGVEGWKIYRSDKYGFEVKFPSSITPTIYESDKRPFMAFDGKKLRFEVRIYNGISDSLDNYYFFDAKPVGDSKLSGLDAKVFINKHGLCDG